VVAKKLKSQIRNSVFFLASLLIVSLGQPALAGALCCIAACAGYALFFLSIDNASRGKRFALFLVWGTCVQFIQLFWMTSLVFDGLSVLLLYSLLCLLIGLQWGVFSLFYRANFLVGAAVWVFIEWLRQWIFCGFSWNPVGLALCHFDISLQFAGIVGVLGLSFWVMLTNLAVFHACLVRKRRSYGIALLFAVVPYCFGYHGKEEPFDKLQVALVQTNKFPNEKMVVDPLEQWRSLCQLIKNSLCERSVDLVVFPETVVPGQAEQMRFSLDSVREVLKIFPGLDSKYFPLKLPYATLSIGGGETGIVVSPLFFAKTLANYFNATIILGLEKDSYNSLFCVLPHQEEVMRYDKHILLPLAEYLPFEGLRSWANRQGFPSFFTAGKGVWQEAWAPSICYEDTFSEFTRKHVAEKAKLLINISNDNYYPGSLLPSQHLTHARVRAAENGIPFVRSSNGGGTAIFDCKGRLVNSLKSGQEGVLLGEVELVRQKKIFSIWGEAGILLVCFMILCRSVLFKFLELKRGKSR
jgi:apolipoprotein N-acyltransferase